MSPADFRRWRCKLNDRVVALTGPSLRQAQRCGRILIWSIITGGFVFTLGYLYGSIV